LPIAVTPSSRLSTASLLVLHLVASCISLASVAYIWPGHMIDVGRDPLIHAIIGTSLALAFVPLLVLAPFSFGYIAAFGFLTITAGYIWISYFSEFHYDHAQARLSAYLSLATFMLPVLFLSVPLPRLVALGAKAMMRLMYALLLLSLIVLVSNATYGVTFVGVEAVGELRYGLLRPLWLRYATGATTGALLPFAFAWFAVHRRPYLALGSLLLLACFYPVLLNKTVLLAPLWLLLLLALFTLFEPRRATVITTLLPMLAGLVLIALGRVFDPIRHMADFAHGFVNFRMLATPSSAMDVYFDFFSSHPLTHFCQVNLVRVLFGCNYEELGVVFANQYHLGNFNASLFATEGIASVGLVWMPLSIFLCGLLLSVGNSLSRRLPPVLIAVSSGVVIQGLLNAPLSTTLLSNGLLVLFLLWYIAPEIQSDPAGGG
jgi:hypothetical protein